MSTGLELAAAGVGITALCVTALHGCIKGFTLLHSARCAGRDLSTIRLMIQCEQHRLQGWAHEVGLFEETLRISDRDASQVAPILEQIAALLNDSKKLKAEYNLNIQHTNEDFQQHDIGDGLVTSPGSESYMVDALRKTKGAWKKLKWVSVDEKKIRKLLQQIRYFVGNLEQYLDRAQRQRHLYHVDVHWRRIIAATSNSDFLSQTGSEETTNNREAAVCAAAQWRKIGLELGVLEGSPSRSIELLPLSVRSDRASQRDPDHGSETAPPKNMRLSKRELLMDVSALSLNIDRHLAYRKDKIVLVEWRAVEATTLEANRTRINKICFFLYELSHPTFHSLECIGYVEDHELRRFGFVLEIPNPAPSLSRSPPPTPTQSSLDFPVEPCTVRMLLDNVPHLSLNTRVEIGIILLETLLQLHTSGWLHKALTSHNLLMFNSPSSRDVLLPSNPNQSMEIYLTGYLHARPDDLAEMTDAGQNSMDMELYRHPLSLGASRTRYRKSFDLYTAGCVLLELGLWLPLSQILRDHHHTQSTTAEQVDATRTSTSEAEHHNSQPVEHRPFPGLDFERLEASAGKRYAGVVQECLSVVTTESEENLARENDRVLGVEAQSLRTLRQIAEII